MTHGKKKMGRAFFIIVLAAILCPWQGVTQAEEFPPKLQAFIKHVTKYQSLELPVEEYFAVLGWVYRVQWDKVLELPEYRGSRENPLTAEQKKANELKESRKEHMQELWWELRDFAYDEADRWEKEGAWKTGRDGMFKQLRDGFDLQGEVFLDKEQKTPFIYDESRVRGVSLIPSMFEDEHVEDESYDDLSIEALTGRWRIRGTNVVTGQSYGRTYVTLENTSTQLPGYFFLHFDVGGFPLWEQHQNWRLTEPDYVMEWRHPSKNSTFKFYRQHKNEWKAIVFDSENKEVELVLYRNQ